MRKGQKYKMWTLKDFYLIEQMKKDGCLPSEIAVYFGITLNCLRKAMYRYKDYARIKEPSKSMKLCSFDEIYKIADDLKINRSQGIIDVLRKINSFRNDGSCPKIVLGR